MQVYGKDYDKKKKKTMTYNKIAIAAISKEGVMSNFMCTFLCFLGCLQ